MDCGPRMRAFVAEQQRLVDQFDRVRDDVSERSERLRNGSGQIAG